MIAEFLVGGPVTVESCRAILATAGEHQVSGDYVATFSNLSEEEKFHIAKQVLPELKAYNDKRSMKSGTTSNKAALNSYLLNCFEYCDGISYEDFSQLLGGSDIYPVIIYLIRNKSFPLSLLLEPTLLKSYQNSPHQLYLEGYVKYVKASRMVEIIAYCRGLVPDSENMSDEIVLNVAGVKL